MAPAAAPAAALARADVGAAYAAIGGLPAPMAQAAFARFIAEENTRWGKVIRDTGISPLGVGSGGTSGRRSSAHRLAACYGTAWRC